MFRNFFKREPKKTPSDAYKKHEHINDYTDSELYEELERAEEVPPHILAVICAEILKRKRVVQ